MTPLVVVEQPDDMFAALKLAAGSVFPCWNARGAHDIEGRGPCWVIRLPGAGGLFHTNMEAASGGCWDVTGDAPNLTVHPSINVGDELWHGWITNGTLDPDTDRNGNR